MVIGVNRFREHFAGHEHQYVLIGGAAYELIMGEAVPVPEMDPVKSGGCVW